MAGEVAATTTAPASRGLTDGYLEGTDPFAGTSPSAQISDTMNGTGTAETAETGTQTATPQRGLQSASVDLRPYKERCGEFGTMTDQFGSYGDDCYGDDAPQQETSNPQDLLSATWDAHGMEDTGEESTTEETAEPAEPKMTYDETTNRNPY